MMPRHLPTLAVGAFGIEATELSVMGVLPKWSRGFLEAEGEHAGATGRPGAPFP